MYQRPKHGSDKVSDIRVKFCPFCGNDMSCLTRFCLSCGRCLEFLNGTEQTEGPNAPRTSDIKQLDNAKPTENPCPSYKLFLEYRSAKSKELQSFNYGPRGRQRAKERKHVQVFEPQNQSTPKLKPKDERDAPGHSATIQPRQIVISDTEDMDPPETNPDKTSCYRVEGISRATIIDLDAHQGNGYERDFLDDRRVFIMDVYNPYIYPGDGYAKRAIKRKVELDWGTEDLEYLQKVELHSDGALNEVRPDILIYNAGTDILDGDPLGGFSISPQGIVKRDEIVFSAARRRGIPILMVTSGGYQKKTARIIADSILNLHRQGLIGAEVEEEEGSSSLMTSLMRSSSGCVGSTFTAV